MVTRRKAKSYYSYVNEWKTMWKPDVDALGGLNGLSCDPTRVDLKVIQWAKDNCAGMPHFVKVLTTKSARNGSTKNALCNVSVPIPFANQYYRELDRVVSLENDEGRTWRVSFGSPRKQPIWHQGWDRVVRDNSLKSGDVVVFVLLRKSCFRFTVFNAEGSIRKKSTTASVNVDSPLICKEEFPGCAARSLHQDQAFVNNPETKHIPKARKCKITMPKGPRHTNQEAGYEERDGSAPDNSYGQADLNQFPVPAEKQIAEASCEERKLQRTTKEVEAAYQALNLPAEEVIKSRGENPSYTNVNATSMKNSPKNEVDPYDPPTGLPTAPRDMSPRFESFDPFAFTFKSRRRMITAMDRQRAGDMAMAHAKNLKEHHFVYAMLETHVYQDFHLVLPDYFAIAANLPESPIHLKFLDCAGFSWDMYSKKNTYNQYALHHKYWALFALHHRLEEGDVCVFTLKEKELGRTVLVRIFRAVPVFSTNSNSVHYHYETHEIDGTPNI